VAATVAMLQISGDSSVAMTLGAATRGLLASAKPSDMYGAP
jgi:hypothetical protein